MKNKQIVQKKQIIDEINKMIAYRIELQEKQKRITNAEDKIKRLEAEMGLFEMNNQDDETVKKKQEIAAMKEQLSELKEANKDLEKKVYQLDNDLLQVRQIINTEDLFTQEEKIKINNSIKNVEKIENMFSENNTDEYTNTSYEIISEINQKVDFAISQVELALSAIEEVIDTIEHNIESLKKVEAELNQKNDKADEKEKENKEEQNKEEQNKQETEEGKEAKEEKEKVKEENKTVTPENSETDNSKKVKIKI